MIFPKKESGGGKGDTAKSGDTQYIGSSREDTLPSSGIDITKEHKALGPGKEAKTGGRADGEKPSAPTHFRVDDWSR